MPIPAIRTKQTTSTTGTGALTLNAASAEFRSWATAFGASSQKVRYILSRAGVYEGGYGTFNGSNQLTRDTVIASTNGGALVSLAAGDTDVFFDFMPGDVRHHNVTGSVTLDETALGNFVRCTPSADMTITLPPIANIPAGMGYIIRNDGTNNAVVYLDANGSEQIDALPQTFPVFAGEGVELLSIVTAWRMVSRPTGWRFVGRSSATNSSSIDFSLPVWTTVSRSLYRVDFRQVRPATDGGILTLRTSTDGGASFAAGASDYLRSQGAVTGAASWSASASADSAVHLSTDIDATDGKSQVTGYVQLNPGAASARAATVFGQSLTRGNGATYAGAQMLVFTGSRDATQDINAIRFRMTTGDIALGDFDLFAFFD